MQPPAPAAPPPVASHTFVVLAGADTFAVERVSTVGEDVVAELRVPAQRARVRHAVTPGPDGTVVRYLVEGWAPGAAADAPPTQRVTFHWGRDTVVVEGGAPPAIAAAPNTLPWLNPSFALVDQLVRRARAVGGAGVEVPMLGISGAERFVATVTGLGRDSAVVTVPDVQMRVAVDGAGRMTGAVIPAQGVRVVRVVPPVGGARAGRLDVAVAPGRKAQ